MNGLTGKSRRQNFPPSRFELKGSLKLGRIDTRVQRAWHRVAPIMGFITKYMNKKYQKSEFCKSLNCFNAGERMNIEHLYKIIIVKILYSDSWILSRTHSGIAKCL